MKEKWSNFRYHHRIGLKLLTALLLTLTLSIISYNSDVSGQGNTITGTVFRDDNINGVNDAAEVGVGGITITAYDASGAVIATTTTATDGTYTLTNVPSQVRVEVTGLTGSLQPGPVGPNSDTSVLFVNSPASNVDIGLLNPALYVSPNPLLITSLYALGGTTNRNGLISFDSNPGFLPPGFNTLHRFSQLTTNDEIGTTWGLAYQRASRSVFLGSFMKRHTAFGSGGTGMIQRYDRDTDTVTQFLDLNTFFPGSTGSDPHPVGTNYPLDPNSWDAVGKISLGDLDISDDELTLWAISLNDRLLYEIPLGTDSSNPTAPTQASDIRRWPANTTPGTNLTDLAGLSTCPNPDMDIRPFGLKVHEAMVYIGMVCSAESTQDRTDLHAYVYRFDPTNQSFTQALTFPLNYPRRESVVYASGQRLGGAWNPWSPTYRAAGQGVDLGYAQPWLTDIEFVNDGTTNNVMVVGLRDRFGDQMGHNAPPPGSTTPLIRSTTAGDLLRALPNAGGNGQWTIETIASANDEFYTHEELVNVIATDHYETASGALVQAPGDTVIATSIMDPNGAFAGGVSWLNNATGRRARDDKATLYTNWGKANGMGDLELLLDPAPIEIGNRVWLDSDSDGVQDPGETPIAGVTVTLHDSSGTQIGTAVTDANGNYIFSSDPNGTSTASHIYNISGLTFNTADFEIRLDTTQAAVAALFLTPANVNSGPNSDIRDSDGILNGSNAVITFSTGGPGENNHTYDFGFNSTPAVSIGSYVWVDTNEDGLQDATESGVAGATVELLVDSGSGTFIPATNVGGSAVLSQTTATDGLYNFVGLPAGDYRVRVTPPVGLSPSPTQTATDNDDTEDDSNIATEPVTGTFESGTFTLSIGGEPTESGTFDGDNQDDSSETNGNMTVDFGFVPSVSIGSYVWIDSDRDGSQDATEPGVAGATVELLVDDGTGNFIPAVDMNGTSVLSQTTATDGQYHFTNLPPGDYRVRVTPPAGHTPTSPQTTTDNDDTEDDSNIAAEPVAGTFESGTFTLTINGEPTESGTFDGDNQDDSSETNGNMTVDFGFIRPVSIGSYVWVDSDRGGSQDATEPGIAGATVELLVDDGTGNFIPAVDMSGTAVPSQTTATDGQYHFTNLPPGDYRVRVTPPPGYQQTPVQTTADNDDTEDDSNIAAEPVTGTFESGTFTLTINGEPTESGTYDGDDQDDANETDGNMTVDFGFVQPVSIGSYIWLDEDGDGVQDATEPGIVGASVELFVDDGTGNFIPAADINGTAVAGQTTAADGLYFFDNLPEGDYRVRVTPPAGHTPSPIQTTTDNDDTEDDSNIATEPVTGTFESGTFTLTVNGEPTETGAYDGDDQDDAVDEDNGNLTVDFGFVQPVSIGSYVWEDSNRDGLQGATEPGIENVTVELFVDDGTGNFIPAVDMNGTSVLSQTTATDGQYHFTNLPPGDYRVRVTPPAGHTPSPIQTTTDNDDTEDDSNIATEPVAGTFESGTFTLTVNGEPTETGTFDGDDQDDATDEDNGNMTVDFGFVQPVSIGSYVWLDENGDGLQDATEANIAGAVVELLVDDGTGNFIPATDINGTAIVNQTTAADGLYFFDNIPPGDYRVRVTPPAGYIPSPPQTTADNDDTEDDSNIASEPSAGVYESGTFTLAIDGEPTESGAFDGDDQDDATDEDNGNMTVDFGFIQPVNIGSFVWSDTDNDGQQDATETAVTGALVELFVDDGTGNFVSATEVNGTAVLSQTTAADGLYFFDNLPPGDYRVRVTPPAGFVPSAVQTTTDNDDTEDDSNIASEPTTGTFESGTFTLTVDGEPTESGTFDGDDQDDAIDEDNGNMTIDFGFVPLVSIGSYIWLDEDADGAQDATEPGIAGATVELLVDDGTGNFILATDINGTAVANQTTAADGLYVFDNLPPGDYRVRVTPPAGHTPTPPQTTADNDDTEDDSNIASEPVVGTYESGTFTLSVDGEPTESGTFDGDDQDDAADEDNGNMTVDFGFVQPVSVGSYVWLDTDGDGLQDATESGITGATVELLVDDGTGNFIPAAEVNGTAVLSQTTAADGLYFFDNLPPGDYRVRVTPPAGHEPTSPQTATDNDDTEDDSNIASEPTANTFESGTFTLSIDGEPTETGTFDGDDQDDASDEDNGNMTVDFGFVTPVSIGSYVWVDEDVDGIQDPTEPGIENATVELLVDDGTGNFIPAVDVDGTAVAGQTTPTDGQYHFTNLPPGDYRVRVTPPAGYIPSPPQTTADNDDVEDDSNIASEPVVGTYESGTFTLSVDGEPTESGTFDGDDQDDATDEDNGNMTVDFGFVQPMSIGSYVWLDEDGDGIQDASEPSIAGATVDLLVDDGTGNFIPAADINGTAIAGQTTATDGLYFFGNLPAGDYRVRVTPPAGHVPTIPQTTADNDDSEDDSNIASEPVAGTYESGTFTLSIDGEPTETGTFDGDDQDDATDEDNGNMTVDFGFVRPVTIGSYIWEDRDADGIQDATEPGIAGAVVELFVDDGTGNFIPAVDVDGTAVAGQTTPTDGQYHFTNLPPGDYRVRVTPPAIYSPTLIQTTADNDDTEDDSNIATEPVAGTYESGTFTLSINGEPTESGTFDGDNQDDANETDGNMTVDFGFVQPVSIGSYVWLDEDGDGLQDAAEANIAGAAVELFVDDGTGNFVPATDLNGTPVASQTTATDGQYNFDNLPEGDYRVRITPPAGHVPTIPQTTADDDDTEDDSNIATEPVTGTYESGTFTLTVDGEPTESGTFDGDDQDDVTDEDNGNMTVDFGFIQPVSIGSYVWLDEDGDGVQDATELGIENAIVELFVDDGTGNFIPATDINGTAMASQTTPPDGQYHFTNLPPGDYRVRVTPPTTFVPTLVQTTTDDDDSEDDSNIATEPTPGTYESGTFTLTVDGEPTEAGTFDGDDQDDATDNDGNMTVDFGFVPIVSIGSYVWLDEDGDGLQDAAEVNIAGAVVELFVDDGTGNFIPAVDVNGTAVANQTTAADGLYFFDNLPAGDYRIRVTPPAGHEPTSPQTTTDNDDSEDDSNIATEPVAGTYESGTFTLSIDGEPTESGTFNGDDQDDATDEDNGNMTVDFGFIQPVSIGSFIWLDEDGDGTQDATEPGIENAIVELFVDDGTGNFVPATDINGTTISSQTTLPNGQYNFTNLPPGDYYILVTPPAGHSPSPIQTTTDNDDTEDDSNIAAEPTPGTFQSGTFTLTVDGEPTESGTFNGDDQDDATDEDNGNMTVDFGFIQPVSIGSFVWVDEDGDGTQDATEPGIENAVVELFVDDGTGNFVLATEVDGTAVASQTTTIDGQYNFTNLPPGDYRVRVTPSASHHPTPPQTTVDDDDTEDDSNIATEPVTGTYESGTFTLTVDGEPTESGTFDGDDQDDTDDPNGNMTIDFGFIQTVSIGSFVWLDEDGDGLQDAPEPGIENVIVELLVNDGTGNFIPATDINGTAVAGQTTTPDGQYNFTDLPAGDYRVRVTPPAGHTPTPPQTTVDDDDTEDDSNIATEPTPGTYESGTFTLTVNGEPTESGTFDGDDQDAASDDDGNMTVDFGFIQPVSIGSLVWFDEDGDGTQDATEATIAGATVELFVDDGTGNFIPATDVSGTAVTGQTTAAGGLYFFDNLPPSDYRVRVTSPAGHVPTIPQTTADNDDSEDDSNIASEPVAGTYESGTFTLSIDGEPTESGTFNGDDQDDATDEDNGNMTVDFGFIQPVSIGSFVWLDEDGDGTQDATEPGIENAIVELFVDDGTGNFVPATDINGTTISSQTTLPNGQYNFTNLPPGDYYILVTPPAGHSPSPIQTTTDNDDTEDDSNIAAEPTPGTFQSGTFTLTVDGEPTESGTFNGDDQDDATDEDNGNMTVDFGFIQPVSIGSFVWLDEDGDGTQDATEPGIENAIVELFVDDGTGNFVPATEVDGTAVASQTTPPNGQYNFTNLPPGDYYILVTPPAGHSPSPIQTTTDDDTEDDSNIAAEPTPGTFQSGTFTLSINGEPTETGTFDGDDQDDTDDPNGNMTIDFGFTHFDLALQKTLAVGQPAVVYPTSEVTFTLTIFNQGTVTATNITLSDYLPTGFTLSPNDTNGWTGAGSTVTTTISGPLGPGEQTSRNIILQVSNSLTNGTHINFAEISTAQDDNGVPATDIDSTPDGDPNNDGPVTDNELNNANGDEDDHDPAQVTIAAPSLDISKVVSAVESVPQQVVTYTIRITNTGNITLSTVTLTDTLDPGLSYLPTATPAPDSVSGQTLRWNDLTGGGDLAPNASLSVTLQATVVTTATGIYHNLAIATGSTPITATPPVTDIAPVGVTDPSVALDKTIDGPMVDRLITFTIQITNTGPSVIDVLPLFDTFSGPIAYDGGTPPADTIDNAAGQLLWTDLTQHFGNLQPGQSILISTRFTLTSQETEINLTNQAIVAGEQTSDVFGNTPNDVSDAVSLNNVPTAVSLLSFNAHWESGEVHLNWQTALEYDNLGFNVVRSETGNLADGVDLGFIPGQGSGTHSGATYTFLDATARPGSSYTYWLIDLDASGQETVHPPVTLTPLTGSDNATQYQLFLPLISR